MLSDRVFDCASWLGYGYVCSAGNNNNNDNIKWMQDNCKLSCCELANAKTGANGCRSDLNDDCTYWGKEGYACNDPWMVYNCANFCCPTTAPTHAVTTSPSAGPTPAKTPSPTRRPSSRSPSRSPTLSPSTAPSVSPTAYPPTGAGVGCWGPRQWGRYIKEPEGGAIRCEPRLELAQSTCEVLQDCFGIDHQADQCPLGNGQYGYRITWGATATLVPTTHNWIQNEVWSYLVNRTCTNELVRTYSPTMPAASIPATPPGGSTLLAPPPGSTGTTRNQTVSSSI